MSDVLVREVARLTVGENEVLVVRPKGVLTANDFEILRKRLAQMAEVLGIDTRRIVLMGRDLDLTVVKAEQLGLGA